MSVKEKNTFKAVTVRKLISDL